jgi:hypothetical protein
LASRHLLSAHLFESQISIKCQQYTTEQLCSITFSTQNLTEIRKFHITKENRFVTCQNNRQRVPMSTTNKAPVFTLYLSFRPWFFQQWHMLFFRHRNRTLQITDFVVTNLFETNNHAYDTASLFACLFVCLLFCVRDNVHSYLCQLH